MSTANVDPELQPTLAAFTSGPLDFSADGLRLMREGMAGLLGADPAARPASVTVQDVTVPGPAGDPDVVLRLYRPAAAPAPVPVLYWMHGGGMVIGSYDMDDHLLADAVDRLGLAAVSVEYRLAPEHPDPAPVEDCYAGLAWTAGHAADFGFDPGRIAVGGVSAGGGLAAGTALLARDRGGPSLRYQLLLEPMLDDRAITGSSTAYRGSVVWDRNDNRFGWTALLGARVGGEDVSPYAAPARATDLAGLPPAWVDVGEVETFRDEVINYAQALLAAGVSTELHVYPGAFHGFDLMAPDSTVARRAWGLRWGAVCRALGLPAPAPVSA
ncbi:MAG: alpha/beta hydrolase [Acidimicrobiales bacterium]